MIITILIIITTATTTTIVIIMILIIIRQHCLTVYCPPITNVKWPVLQLRGERDYFETKLEFFLFLSPERYANLITGELIHLARESTWKK